MNQNLTADMIAVGLNIDHNMLQVSDFNLEFEVDRCSKGEL